MRKHIAVLLKIFKCIIPIIFSQENKCLKTFTSSLNLTVKNVRNSFQIYFGRNENIFRHLFKFMVFL